MQVWWKFANKDEEHNKNPSNVNNPDTTRTQCMMPMLRRFDVKCNDIIMVACHTSVTSSTRERENVPSIDKGEKGGISESIF